jgi:hypothetical protein
VGSGPDAKAPSPAFFQYGGVLRVASEDPVQGGGLSSSRTRTYVRIDLD